MTTILTNRTRRMLVFALYHDEYCEHLGRCACTENCRRGSPAVPDSLTSPAQSSVEVDDAVLRLTDVVSAIRRGELTATAKPEAQPRPQVDETAAMDGALGPSCATASDDSESTSSPQPADGSEPVLAQHTSRVGKKRGQA
ncbi:MAG TPA: hypothetical protein VKP30_06720 [Polyangiaceae bacterium]|nr:hypothetical protein [Polyangiaceae bacterium]